jgi:HAD superfamily phosphoserine phosphatase-like hydrolase
MFKKRFLRCLLAGQPVARIRDLMEEFLDRRVQRLINQKVLGLLQKQQAQGEEVYLLSSNFDFLLDPLCQRWKLAGVLSTRAERLNGIFTGRLLGQTCHGEEKLARVMCEFGEQSVRQAVAYGDGKSDASILLAVAEGYWVRPKGILRATVVPVRPLV